MLIVIVALTMVVNGNDLTNNKEMDQIAEAKHWSQTLSEGIIWIENETYRLVMIIKQFFIDSYESISGWLKPEKPKDRKKRSIMVPITYFIYKAIQAGLFVTTTTTTTAKTLGDREKSVFWQINDKRF